MEYIAFSAACIATVYMDGVGIIVRKAPRRVVSSFPMSRQLSMTAFAAVASNSSPSSSPPTSHSQLAKRIIIIDPIEKSKHNIQHRSSEFHG